MRGQCGALSQWKLHATDLFSLCLLHTHKLLFPETARVSANAWSMDLYINLFTAMLAAPFLTPELSAYFSQKQRPLDNELFLSRARHSGTRYRMIFFTQYQHLSSKP